jgi:RsiW-degrading membrane proteinase PrsW (M82 family)
VLRIAVSLLPVLAFLGALVLMDSFKLVRARALARSLGVGALAAVAAALLHGLFLDGAGWSPRVLSIAVAPSSEELLKALYLAWLIRGERVGFLVDAAVHGFAVGTGFALVENAEYASVMPDGRPWLWVARGFGTALLHGSAAAVFAVVSKALRDRPEGPRAMAFLPGYVAAALLHAAFNHFASSLATTLALLVVLPVVVIAVFARSEKATRDWLGVGFDSDAELLRTILEGRVGATPLGRYLASLQSRFDGLVVADMLCLLRVQAELSMRAKGLLMAREAGFDVPVGDDVERNLAEMRYLEKAIGPTGLLALKPIQTRSRRELWEVYVLKQEGGGGLRPPPPVEG